MAGRTYNTEVPLPEYVETDEEVQDLLHLSLRKVQEEPGGFIGFDTETTAKKMKFKVGTRYPLDWMSDTVTFWSLSFDFQGEARRFCIPGECFQYFAPLLENPDAWLACWNAKFDAHISWNMGINIWNAKVVDGLALAGLHDENRMQRGLKPSAHMWRGLPMTKFTDLFPREDEYGKKIKEYVTPLYDLPIDLVVDYASYDAYCHLRTVEWVVSRLKATPVDTSGYSLWDYFLSMETKITEVLWRMERRGLYIDEDMLRSKIPGIDKEMAFIANEINRQAGKPINLASPQQLAEMFFDSIESGGLGLPIVKKTGSGGASVDKEVLGVLASSGVSIAESIVRYRSIAKTKSTYLTTLLDLSEHYGDHRVHPEFNQFGAVTGRFSTKVPNSQNFPRPDTDEFGIRTAFIAPPGKVLIVADYAQLEMRIMAHMSGDQGMVEAILEGKDLHSFTVSRMVPGVTYEEVVAAKKSDKPTKHQKWLLQLRQDMKAVGFGIIYGAGPPRISESIDIPEEDVTNRIVKLQREETVASAQERKRGYTFSQRVAKMIQRNSLLSKDKASIQVARQSIARDKIQAYFDTFPGVKAYMTDIPNECRESMEFDFHGNNRDRPVDGHGFPIDDEKEYDWDIEQWYPEAHTLTRTGHPQRFGIVQTLCGRYRRLVDINSGTYRKRSEAERQAVNTTIQGSASDLTKAAMLRIEFNRELNMLGAELLNQVHDELVLQAPEENADRVLEIVLECMEHPFKKGMDPLIVPIPAEGKIVVNWALAK